jgi:acetyl esterase/lipase
MSFDPVATAKLIRSLGPEIAMPSLAQIGAHYGPFHESEPYQGVRVFRDIAYGKHDRNRLDIIEPETASKDNPTLPVLLFVHGGGFVGGDKRNPGTPYNDNVALWAARHGMVGVNMTYRLAPEHGYPAGAEDIAAAVAAVRKHIGQHGGDADNIYLLGTSAGAVHVATYVARKDLHPEGKAGIAGAILLSGMYDLTQGPHNEMHYAYYGRDASAYGPASTVDGLVDSDIPLFFVLTEMDPANFQAQTLQLLNRYFDKHGVLPNFVRLQGHSHFSSTLHMNTPDNYLGEQILDFVHNVAPSKL